MRSVEASLKNGLQEWHTAQTLYMMSLVQAAMGDHRGSADTLVRLTNDHESHLNGEIRAYVTACAAAALQTRTRRAPNGRSMHVTESPSGIVFVAAERQAPRSSAEDNRCSPRTNS